MHTISTLALGVQRATEATPTPLAGAGPDLGWMATVVAITLVCILGVAYGVRRVVGGAWRARSGRRSLRVLDVLPLGGRRQVVVVRCYDRTFALGLGEREVSLVAELDTEFVAAEAREGAVTAGAPTVEFRALLSRAAEGVVSSRVGAAAQRLAGHARSIVRPNPPTGTVPAVAAAVPAAPRARSAASTTRGSHIDVVSAEPLPLQRRTPALPSIAEALAREDEVVA